MDKELLLGQDVFTLARVFDPDECAKIIAGSERLGL